VEALLNGGANPNLAAHGKPLLFTAVKSPDLLRLLLANKADVKVVGESGYTPLHEAASAGSESVKLLLAAGANVNAKSQYGDPPLSVAVRNRNDAAVEVLLEAGADPNILFRTSDTSSSRWSPLHAAAFSLNQKRVRLLLARGANVGIKDSDGNTPLHWAARSQSDQAHAMVALLLASGADVSARNNKGETALDIAEQHRLVSPRAAEIKTLLLEASGKKPPTP
jgi:ankyrin repeat protein